MQVGDIHICMQVYTCAQSSAKSAAYMLGIPVPRAQRGYSRTPLRAVAFIVCIYIYIYIYILNWEGGRHFATF